MADFGNLSSGVAFHFPDRRRRIPTDHQKQATKCRILGQVRLGQFMLPLTGSRLDDRNPLLAAERMQAAGKCPRHLPQILVIQLRVVAVQVAPQGAYAATGLPHREESVEDDAIHAIVGPLQQLGVIVIKIIGRVHAPTSTQHTSVCGSCSRQRTSLFQFNRTTPTLEAAAFKRRRADRRFSRWLCRHGNRQLRVGCWAGAEDWACGGNGCWRGGHTGAY